MKRLSCWCIAIAVIFSACGGDGLTRPSLDSDGPVFARVGKVSICHRSQDGDGNVVWKSITIAGKAANAHLRHGDEQPGGDVLDADCVPHPPAPATQTAFAFSGDSRSSCFLDLGFDTWGWTIGTLSDGRDGTFDLYVGAEQCDASAGTLVGTLSVEIGGGDLNATFTMIEPYFLVDSQFFWGTANLPRDGGGQYTIDPAHYTESHDPVSDPTSDRFGAFYVGDWDIFVIARATVGGF